MTHPIQSLRIERFWNGDPAPAQDWITLHLILDEGGLTIRVDAPFYGDPVAPEAPVGSIDKLWEHEVVEVFLLGDDEHYTEIEMAPSGHYLVLQLQGVRNPVRTELPLNFKAEIQGNRWRGEAVIDRNLLPLGSLKMNATAIHGSGLDRSYLSWIPLAGDAPDFHQIDRFRLVF